MLKIPTNPRIVEIARVPGLTDAITALRQKALALNDLQASKPESEREEYSVQIGVDCIELRSVKVLTVNEHPEEAQKRLQETADRLIQQHQKAQEARYRKALQEYAEGNIGVEDLHIYLPEHKKDQLEAVAKRVATTLRRAK